MEGTPAALPYHIVLLRLFPFSEWKVKNATVGERNPLQWHPAPPPTRTEGESPTLLYSTLTSTFPSPSYVSGERRWTKGGRGPDGREKEGGGGGGGRRSVHLAREGEKGGHRIPQAAGAAQWPTPCPTSDRPLTPFPSIRPVPPLPLPSRDSGREKGEVEN